MSGEFNQPEGWQPEGWQPGDEDDGVLTTPPSCTRIHFLWNSGMRTVYLGRENVIELALEADRVMRNASDFTRYVLYLKEPQGGTTVTIDQSTAGAGVFDTSRSRYFNLKKISTLGCKLGLGGFGLVANRIYEAYLRAYNDTFTNGIVFPDQDGTFRIKVVQGP